MVRISPRRLQGNWFEGYALDLHTLSSVFLGYDEYGHGVFDSKRSELGELLYKLKFKSDNNVINEIIETVISFFELEWQLGDKLDGIIPVPPSRTRRTIQPVIELAKGISLGLDIPLYHDYLLKIKETPELKNIYDFQKRLEILKDIFNIKSDALAGKNVLIFDDLYRSGATLNAATNVIYNSGRVAKVYVLVLTKTRSIR